MAASSRKKSVVALIVLAVTCVGIPSAVARSVHVGGLYISTGGGCPAPPSHRDTKLGRIATANTYLRSLVTHDTSDLQVAQTVVRTEEGGVTADGAEEICKGNQGPVTVEDAVFGMREKRWVVSDGAQVISFYLLDSPTSPTYIAERFEVRNRLIQHIEAIFYIDVTGLAVGPESAASRPEGVSQRLFNSDDGPVGFYAPASHLGDISDPVSTPRSVMDAAIRSYVQALVSHKAAGVPLAKSATRTDNRRVHGANGAAIRSQMQSGANKVKGVSDLHVYIEGDQAVAMYKITTPAQDKISLGTVAGLGDVWAATRIRVSNGQIIEIESICSSSRLCGSTA